MCVWGDSSSEDFANRNRRSKNYECKWYIKFSLTVFGKIVPKVKDLSLREVVMILYLGKNEDSAQHKHTSTKKEGATAPSMNQVMSVQVQFSVRRFMK